jgi:hypothetical protein
MRGDRTARTAFILLSTALLAGGATACTDAFAPELHAEGPVPGVLQLDHYTGAVPAVLSGASSPVVRWSSTREGVVVPPQAIVAPDTVDAGVPFEVTTYTIGESGCWSAGHQEVQVGSGVVELRPFDVHSGNDICTLILLLLPHRSELVIPEAGEWVLRVNGRRARFGQLSSFVPVSAERTIVVR